MAYTFAVQAVDGYFEDPDAIDISSILSNADFMELKEKSIVRDLSKSSLWNTLNTNSENHYFILLSDKDTCSVSFVYLIFLMLSFIYQKRDMNFHHQLSA